LGECTTGCTDSSACNFDSEANYDDGSCEPCACPGDVNGDFSVTVADMLLLLGQFDCTTDCPADLNEDGVVGVGDLLILLAFFGTDC